MMQSTLTDNERTDAKSDDRVPGVSLALEVATVTSRGRATLPDEDVYMASCECAQATVERLIAEDSA